MTSYDAVSWTPHASGTTNSYFNRLRFLNGRFVAVGDGDAIVTSFDGANWTPQNSGLPIPPSPHDPNNYLSHLYNVTYANGIYVIVGKSSTILTSPDSAHWTPQTINVGCCLGDVAFGDGTFVISGYGGVIRTSPNGTAWTSQNSLPLPSSGLAGLVYAQGSFVGVGGGGAIFTSPNGTNWTQRMSGTGVILWNVKYVNGTFMAVGENGTILQTVTFPQIVQQPTGQFAQVGNNVVFSVSASGAPPLGYQWRLNGQLLAGATSPTLTLDSVGAVNSGAYSVVVWNSYGSATSAAAQLTISQPLTLVQTSRAPTAAESAASCPALPAQFKTFANGAFGSTGTVSPAKQTIVFTHGWIPSVGPWALTQGYQGWPTDLAGALAAQGFGANANIVAWDWSSAAKSFPCNPGQAAGQTPTQGAALGQALLAALGPGYSHHIHFIGHSFGTMVNAGAANYLQANGYSWMNTEMTLLDEAEIGTDVGCLDLFALALWSMPSSSQTCYQPLPLNCAWADNYVSLVGQLHPKAANVILSYGLPSAEPSILGLIVDAASFHAYPCTWYSNTIPNPNSAWMGFRWSFEEGGFAAAPAVGTVYLQSASGSQSDLVITDWTSASSLLSQRFQGYHAAAWLTGFADVSTLGTADGVVVGQAVWGEVASGVQATINLVTHSGGGSLGPNSGPHPLDDTPGTNALACAWIPVTVPSNAVLMSFDFVLQGDGQQDSFAAALNGTNILSLATSLIQTNVALNSGPIGVSQYAGQQVELFLGIVGGTSTNASVAVSNFRFYAMPAPALRAQVLGTSLIVSWPVWATDYSLEASSTLTGTGVWTPITNAPVIVDFQNTITNEISAGSRFYRLHQQ